MRDQMLEYLNVTRHRQKILQIQLSRRLWGRCCSSGCSVHLTLFLQHNLLIKPAVDVLLIVELLTLISVLHPKHSKVCSKNPIEIVVLLPLFTQTQLLLSGYGLDSVLLCLYVHRTSTVIVSVSLHSRLLTLGHIRRTAFHCCGALDAQESVWGIPWLQKRICYRDEKFNIYHVYL